MQNETIKATPQTSKSVEMKWVVQLKNQGEPEMAAFLSLLLESSPLGQHLHRSCRDGHIDEKGNTD